jgi:hypothetical protein
MKWFLTLFLAVFILLPGISQAQQVTDGNLKSCIASAAGRSFDSLSDKDLAEITVLECPEKDIFSIAGIENLANLVELNLNDNWIKDVRPLAALTGLDHLEIYKNQVTDITPLKGLTRLEYLDATGNSISDVSVLLNLGGLTRLFLNGNSITDIQALAGLKSIKKLFLGYNQIRDIRSLAKLAELKILDLNSNRVDDIFALRKLVNLQRLTLDNNLVSNIRPLIGLPNLSHVSLLNNCIKNVGALAEVKSVTGMGYQHDLCSSPNLVKKTITNEWLDQQIERQCINFDGESDHSRNDYSLKVDYYYYPYGIYYNYYVRDNTGKLVRTKVCGLPWNSNIKDFLFNLEKTDSAEDNFELLQYREFHIYVKDRRVKGYSVNNRRKVGGKFIILDNISEMFGIHYSFKKQRSGSMSAEGDGHVVRIVDMGEKYSLQFFEPGFYTEEISKGK